MDRIIYRNNKSLPFYCKVVTNANSPAGISAKRPEISLRASAQREVESAIMLTLYPMSLKYSDSVIPVEKRHL